MLPVADHADCFPVERLPGIEIIGIPNLNAIGAIFEDVARGPMAKTGLGRMQQLGKIQLETRNDLQADRIGSVQERCGRKPAIHDGILRKTPPEIIDGTPKDSLPSGIFTVPRTIGFDIDRQGQTRSDNSGHH